MKIWVQGSQKHAVRGHTAGKVVSGFKPDVITLKACTIPTGPSKCGGDSSLGLARSWFKMQDTQPCPHTRENQNLYFNKPPSCSVYRSSPRSTVRNHTPLEMWDCLSFPLV